MKKKFKIEVIVISIGLFLISCALIISLRTGLTDLTKGIFFGIGMGVIASPFFIKKLRCDNR
jgi:hypothetical protein